MAQIPKNKRLISPHKVLIYHLHPETFHRIRVSVPGVGRGFGPRIEGFTSSLRASFFFYVVGVGARGTGQSQVRFNHFCRSWAKAVYTVLPSNSSSFSALNSYPQRDYTDKLFYCQVRLSESGMLLTGGPAWSLPGTAVDTINIDRQKK